MLSFEGRRDAGGGRILRLGGDVVAEGMRMVEADLVFLFLLIKINYLVRFKISIKSLKLTKLVSCRLDLTVLTIFPGTF